MYICIPLFVHFLQCSMSGRIKPKIRGLCSLEVQLNPSARRLQRRTCPTRICDFRTTPLSLLGSIEKEVPIFSGERRH